MSDQYWQVPEEGTNTLHFLTASFLDSVKFGGRKFKMWILHQREKLR